MRLGLDSGASSLASPKSNTLTRPSSVTMTLLGFKSRCTMPRSCAADNASASGTPISKNCGSGRPPGTMRVSRLWPSTSSMAINRLPSASSTEKMVTMLGWFSEASERASRSKRARRSASCATAGGSILIATSRPSFVSVARNTSPMPPAPRAAVMR